MKTLKCFFILLVIAAIAAGCSVKKEEQVVIVKPAATEDNSNQFALELYAKLREEQGNIFFSPYSISTALAMTYAGARGETEKQMAEVLHFALPQELLHPALSRLQRSLNESGEQGAYELTVSNALWGQKGYGFLKEFLETIKINYDGGFNEVDFAGDSESARKTINAWVEKETNNKIKDIIGPGVLKNLTRLVLTNAIYFKGNWAKQFNKDKTKERPFTLLNGEKIDVPMMNQRAELNYMETEDFQGLELPYVDNDLSMIILLPKKIDGLSELEKSFTVDNLSIWLEEFRKHEIIVSIPKFKMTNQFSLNNILKSMGMNDAFGMKADFSGMDGTTYLFISAVIHQAFVDVNEEGTEAAAATVVVMQLKSALMKTPVFQADHPFMFLIRDNHSGSILFIGRVMNPKKGG